MSFMGNIAGNKALSVHTKGDYRTALKLYDEAYEKGMDKPRLLRSYCVLLIRTSQFDRALEVIKKLEKTALDAKGKTDIHINYAIILWKKGHLDRAMQILRAKLYEAEQEKQNAAVAAERKSQIGSGDRSERVRTYNFPQNRVTDHRLTGDNKNFNIAAVINGDLDGIIDALVTADQAEKLSSQAEN